MECGIKSIFGALLFVLLVSLVKSADEPKFIPSHYKLHIITDEKNYLPTGFKNTFSGEVTIAFESDKVISEDFKITLDADKETEFQVDADQKIIVTLKGASDEDDSRLQEVKVSPEKVVDKLVLHCKKKDGPNNNFNKLKKFQLTVGFTNPFGKDMTGFYRSIYKEGTTENVLLTTHFEPIFARKAFPCFDRPDLKATFEVSITAPNKYTVLSNTPIKPSEADNADKVKKYTFEKTNIPMSTYLVAFTVSKFEGTEPETFKSKYKKRGDESETKEKDVKLKTYGRKAIIKDKQQGALAQKFGKAAMEGLTKYLEIGYPLDKIDQVGIPDFSAGAMENFGHVSYREKALFFDNEKSTAATQQSNVLTITHELVHQWFGNLVTLEKWDYIWLNEAFATYIEYIIASQFPDTEKWNLLNQMVVNEIHLRAFETDGLESSKPLTHEIKDDSLIFASFNDIPYSKGAAVLRMWNLQLENDEFRNTLVRYVSEYREHAVKPENLLKSFKKPPPNPNPNPNKNNEEKELLTKENFDAWTIKAGYPVVEVKRANDTFTLTQTRFFWHTNKNDTVYTVPITYSSDNLLEFDKTIPKHWLKGEKLTFNHKCKWIIVNNQQAGYYRVNYEKDNWNALDKALKAADHSKIPELNRAQIINDVFSLARSLQKDYVDYATALNISKYLSAEKDFVPWKTALNAFEFLRNKIEKKDLPKFKDYVLPLITPHFKTLDSSKMGHIDKLKNVEMARLACSLDYDVCVKEAKEIFNKSTYNTLPDTQEIILCTVVRNDKSAWDKVSEMYKKEDDSALKVMYISALGCTSDQAKVEEFLKKTLTSDSQIRKQDLTFALSAMYNGNLDNVETAFKFIENNFEKIATNYGGINPLGRALVGIARKLKTSGQYDRLKKLGEKIKEQKISGVTESVENALNIAHSNVKWVNTRLKDVQKYINSGSFLSYSIALLSLSLLTVFQF